jgi:hypothetical protein
MRLAELCWVNKPQHNCGIRSSSSSSSIVSGGMCLACWVMRGLHSCVGSTSQSNGAAYAAAAALSSSVLSCVLCGLLGCMRQAQLCWLDTSHSTCVADFPAAFSDGWFCR